MSLRIAYLNIAIIAIGLPFLIAMYFLPFNFFVDIKYLEHQDVCAGEDIQTVISLRDVKFTDQYEGHIKSELVKFENNFIKETIIKRETDFFYEKNDKPVIYEVQWNKPLPLGEYGVNSLVTIDTVFEKQDFRGAETQRFSVVDCEE